ncbi:MAG: hypothetical protein HY791_14520 [Deltaproteobacteria bacterium]|nr:hypothetical protein [Deltaproteobacteria bacterium]
MSSVAGGKMSAAFPPWTHRHVARASSERPEAPQRLPSTRAAPPSRTSSSAA